jgi:threonine aldolase
MIINLASDTNTEPTAPMREAMYAAEVGDEQSSTDPTVGRLLELVCELLGKEAAVFLPSGTMCNLIAELVHCPRGSGILLDASAHVLHAEGGGFAAIGGAVPHIIRGERGIYTADQLAAAQVHGSHYTPDSRLVWVEQTTNLGGGACWPLSTMEEVCEYARWNRMASHLDGARLMNAVVATSVPARDYAAPFDSVWLGLTKGLGAPFGAVLAGTRDFIKETWMWKQRLGGAMRQAGIMAAGCIYALEHHVERLREDHDRAKQLVSGLAGLPGIAVLQPAETNIVLVDVSGAGCSALYFANRMSERGVRLFEHLPTLGPHVLRMVTHMHIRAADIEETLRAMEQVLGEIPPDKRGGDPPVY